MTNSRLIWNGGGCRNSQANHGTPSSTSERTEVAVSVDDIKEAVFVYDKKMLDNYLVSKEKFLQFSGSKVGPSEQLSLEGGLTVMHNAVKPREIETKQEYEAMNFTEMKTWDLQLKSWNIKRDKVLDNMCRLYPYLWN